MATSTRKQGETRGRKPTPPKPLPPSREYFTGRIAHLPAIMRQLAADIAVNAAEYNLAVLYRTCQSDELRFIISTDGKGVVRNDRPVLLALVGDKDNPARPEYTKFTMEYADGIYTIK